MPSSTSSSDTASARNAKHDERLIALIRRASDGRFLTTMAVTFATLCVLWNFAPTFAPRHEPTFNQLQANRAKLIRFQLEEAPPVVLAGSSLIHRLVPEYFEGPVGNLGMAGGTPVTGAVIGAKREPDVLVIEINILDRRPDEELTREAEKALNPPLGLPLLSMAKSPVRSLVAAVTRLDAKDERERQKRRGNIEALLANPAPPQASDTAHSERIDAWTRRPVGTLNRPSAMALRAALDEVEEKGGGGYYVLMPIHSSLARTAYARRGYEELKAVDPKFDRRFLDINWSPEIRWEDGIHPDQRSAVIIARQIEEAVRARRSERRAAN